mgnify:FL=1
MEIKLTEKAVEWFKEEMEIEHGDYIRFYARYGGSSPFHEGFSLGMTREQPHEIGIETVIEDVHFFIEKSDEWFFSNHHLVVDVDESSDELSKKKKK